MAIAVAAFAALVTPAAAFDLQGHRGARGLAPENTLEAFATALSIGVTTLELDLGMTKDGVLVVSHDVRLDPDHTRGPDGAFLAAEGPPIRSLTLAEIERFDIGRIKPGTAYARLLPSQRPVDGARIPALTEVFDLVKRAQAPHIRFNIETKLRPDTGSDTPDPETFAGAVAAAIRQAGLGDRVTLQSFDWRTLQVMRRIAPEIERSCLTTEQPYFDNIAHGQPGASPWTAGFDIDDYGGSTPALVTAAGCAVWSPNAQDLTPKLVEDAKARKLKILPWTVNDPNDMGRTIAWGVDGLITDYPDRLREVMQARGLPLPGKIPAKP